MGSSSRRGGSYKGPTQHGGHHRGSTIAQPPSRRMGTLGLARSPEEDPHSAAAYSGQGEGIFRLGATTHGITAARCSVIGHTLVQYCRARHHGRPCCTSIIVEPGEQAQC
uniref:Uncharacterized protein n=1 Tax=Anopheles coluzzii TaxID=1518534 RepID=A0A8W7PU73_ANOCL